MDEYDGGDDGHLSGAGSLLSINVRNNKRAPEVARPRSTLSEKLVDHWKAVETDKGHVEAADFSSGELAGIWNHCFEFEPDGSKGFRIVRIGRILHGGTSTTEAGPAVSQIDMMGSSTDIAAMLIDWLKSLASQSFQARQPISEREKLPVQTGGVDYTCTVVPLTNRQSVPISIIGLIESVEGSPKSKGLNR